MDDERPMDRITSRLQRQELSRVSMPEGGSVYQGATATRALEALGARAMTVDQTIIVGEDFNPTDPADQALYAHEMYHVEHGDGEGGGSGDNFRDAEEVAARAAESMALQRSAAGGVESGYQPGAGQSQNALPDQAGHGVGAGVQGADNKSEAVKTDPDPVSGYKHLKAEGYSHPDVVDYLARKIMSSIDERDQVKTDRYGGQKSWF